MSYFFDLSSIFGNDEKQASPVKSTEEEKLTKAEGKQNEQQEQESEDIMGTAPRKGWLDWPFWKRNDNNGGPFNAFRKNKNPGAFTFRKDVTDAMKAKECGKGEGSKDVAVLNVGRSSSESSEEEGQSKATESINKMKNTDGGKRSVSDHEKDVPLVTYNDRPNGGKDVALNMRKVEALRDKKQNDLQTQQRTAPSVGVLEEKYSPNGQAQPANVQAMKPEIKVPGSSAQTTSSSANKQKVDAAAKTKKAIRQLPTPPKEQKRNGTTQVVPTNANTKATQRQETVPKWNTDTKIVAGKKNAERKPVENKKIDNKNEVKKVGEAKKTVVEKNDGLNQSQKPVLQKPVIPRANCAKIDEKPSISSSPNKTAAKTDASSQVKQKDPVTKQIADKSKTEANKPVAQETGKQKNVATGSPGLANATVPKSSKCTNNVTPNQQRPAPEGVRTQNLPPQNQRLTRLQNPGSQVPKQNIVATTGLKNGSKPSNATLQPSQQQRIGPQTPKSQNIGPQSAKSQNIGPQCPKPGTQDPRIQIPVQQNQCLKSNHSPQVGPKSITTHPQAVGVQQSHMQSPMPQATNPQFPIPQNPPDIGPPLKRPYSEVADPQQASPQRTRPEGVSPQASPIRTNVRQKRSVNRRRAPGLAKLVKPAGETQPVNGETTRQDPKEPDNVPKRKILCSRDGREVVIEPNMPVTLPGSLINTHGNRNVSKPTETEKKCPVQNTMPKGTKPEFPVKQEKLAQQVKPVKPVMKDASTSTLTPSTLVDAAVQVPDEEENAGDEIQSLLVKRPWDTDRVMKMQVLLDEKLVVIGRMREMLRKRRDDIKSTKKRCSELETVIKASNMQGKPQLVAQVNEITDIKNELVAEVTNLTVGLEKERTNVKSLKTELADVRAQLTAARKKAANPTGQ